MGEVDGFDLSLDLDNPYDMALDETTVMEDELIFKNKRMLREPVEVYKEALADTNKNFASILPRLKSSLCTSVKRKYGVTLNI